MWMFACGASAFSTNTGLTLENKAVTRLLYNLVTQTGKLLGLSGHPFFLLLNLSASYREAFKHCVHRTT